MNDREKAIVMAYTGYCMLAGDKLSVFYEYVESIMGRPVYTHEMGTKVVDDLIKEKARPDFMALCADEGSSEKSNKWIPVSEKLPSDCGYDWVLAQIQESDTGYLWLPCVAEYRKGIDDWFSDANDIRWLRKHEGAFKVIAWMPLPEPYKASPTGAEGRDKHGKQILPTGRKQT